MFEPHGHQEYFLALLKQIEKIAKENLVSTPDVQTQKKSLQQIQKQVGSQAIVFLVGSFDANEGDVLKEIALLAHQNEVYMIDVFDCLEALCPPKGVYMAEYKGQKEKIENLSEKYELTYEAYFEKKRQALKDFCSKNGAYYRPVRSDLPIYAQLRPI